MYDEAANFTHIIAQLQTGAGQIREFPPLKNGLDTTRRQVMTGIFKIVDII